VLLGAVGPHVSKNVNISDTSSAWRAKTANQPSIRKISLPAQSKESEAIGLRRRHDVLASGASPMPSDQLTVTLLDSPFIHSPRVDCWLGPPARRIEITFVDCITEWQHLEIDSAATVELPVRRVRDRGQETGSLPVGVVSQESKLRQAGVGERREHGGEAIGHREINMIG
jgi:hypothetical protein